MYGGETEVLADLTGRQMETLLRHLAEGGAAAVQRETVNPALTGSGRDAVGSVTDMDYVREELARQRLALALLMMGERTREPVEERMGQGNRSLCPRRRSIWGRRSGGTRPRRNSGCPEVKRRIAVFLSSGGRWRTADGSMAHETGRT